MQILNNFLLYIKKFTYLLQGRKPWGLGYLATRNLFIKNALAQIDNQFQVPTNYGYKFDERVIEYPWLISHLSSQPTRILDAGSVLNFAFILEHKKLQSKRIQITTLAPERNCFWKRGISYTYEDLRNLSLKDQIFDEIVCISTLEHIGLNNEIYFKNEIGSIENTTEINTEFKTETHLLAIKEFYRLLKPKGKLFLTVPYGKAQKLSWLQVFDSNGVDKIIQMFNPSTFSETIYLHTKNGWQESNRQNASQARYYDTHNPDLTVTNLAAAEAIVALILQKP